MAMRPAAFLYLAWLPFWEAKKKPCSWSARMTSEELSRLGIDHFLADGDFTDWRVGVARLALEVKLHCFLQISDCLLAGTPKTGHLHVQALGHDELILAV